jgi:hypothetical protein
MNANKTTNQVPVFVAEDIAHRFKKAQVIILCYDPKSEMTTTTTFGRSAFDKENAAAVGELVTKAIGCDLSKKQIFEDFHDDYSPAFYKEAKDIIRKFVVRGEGPVVLLKAGEEFLRRAAVSSKS